MEWPDRRRSRACAAWPPRRAVDDASHLQHALFAQSREAMHRLDARLGRVPDEHTRNAGALTDAADRAGITSNDDVIPREHRARLFAVQGEPGSPSMRTSCVETQEACRQSLADSTHALATHEPDPQRRAEFARVACEVNRSAPERGMTVQLLRTPPAPP